MEWLLTVPLSWTETEVGLYVEEKRGEIQGDLIPLGDNRQVVTVIGDKGFPFRASSDDVKVSPSSNMILY